MGTKNQQIVILGAGFAGVYTAKELCRLKKKHSLPIDVHLINKENYMVFQPLLPEVLAGSVGVADTVTPIRKLVPGAILHLREVELVDIESKTVTCSPGFRPKALKIPYDQLVFALGNVTNYKGMRGLSEHAFGFKTLGDALAVRNHIIHICNTLFFSR